ncbi:BspA family leucine-rich repeat surface protein [Polaribacter sp. MSW13]|uniref:BspA family leucine-rich repeat surface protein n=1 Tax=Polaribacter marinus TaxID=2916838 RepID=A0A9X1VSD4_9FLAO|nr:BspA family leucine-rich repeat surface protein [Polaribacter marinus]MCI2229915.1 BspA family leucine-rich repeat surface protein [Polaribacter marinus]
MRKNILLILFIATVLITPHVYAAGSDDFVITVKTDNTGTSADDTFVIPTYSLETYNYNVDCNDDGTMEFTAQTGNVTCDYSTIGGAGTYTIRIEDNVGDGSGFPAIYFIASVNKEKIVSVDQWGTGKWTSFYAAFYGAKKMVVNATDTPDLSNVDSTSFMFKDAYLANPNTTNWDTSNVTNMSRMFETAIAANPDTTNWNTANVTDMSFMFKQASIANPNTTNWNIDKVTNMEGMFYQADLANPNTINWNTINVTNMSNMFVSADLANPNVSNWNTSNVTTMQGMFQGATSANPNTTNWNTDKVTNMAGMFAGATSANPDVSGWNTSSVTIISDMFSGATSANPDTTNWNISKVSNLTNMFRNATSANPNVSNWDTSKITDMKRMFQGATSAIPNTTNWDTSKLRNISEMFQGATTANPDVSNWDVVEIDNAYNAMTNSAFSTTNYDALLENWSAQALQSGVNLGVVPAEYCSINASIGRDDMINGNNWSITDNGLGGGCTVVPPQHRPASAPDLLVSSDTGTSSTDNSTSETNPDFDISCTQTGNTVTLYSNQPSMNTIIGSHTCVGVGTETIATSTTLSELVHNISYTETITGIESAHSPVLPVSIVSEAAYRFTLNLSDGTNTKTTRIVIGTGDGYEKGLDVGYDAGAFGADLPGTGFINMFDSKLAVYTRLIEDTLGQGLAFTIQSLPESELDDMTTEVGVSVASDTNVVLDIDIADILGNPTTLPVGNLLILEDRLLGTFTELQDTGTSYTTAVSTSESEIGRFYLHMTTDVTDPTGPGSMSLPTTLINDINANIVGSCGTDVSNGSVLVTTTPVNGFTNQYNTSIRLDANGDFTITDPNWSEGSYSVNFSCTDKVGNGPTTMGPFGPIEIDTTPPPTPTTPDLQAGSDTGLTNSDNNTSDSTPTFDITCTESDSTITLYAEGISAGTHVCTAIGSTMVMVSTTLLDGTYDFTISETDLAGNESPQSSSLSVVIDTTIDPVTLNTPTTGSPLSGTADVNSTVTITTPSGATCTNTANATGAYTCTLSPSPVDGENITAISIDIFGNTASTIEVGGIDTNAPGNPIINLVTAGDTVITGSGENGTTITLDIATCTNAPVIVAGGVWSCDLKPTDAPNKGEGIVATSTDIAGNYSTGVYRIPSDKKTSSKRVSKARLKEIFGKKIEEIVLEEQAEPITNETKYNCFVNYNRLIKRGMQGGDVKQVQKCIASLGYPTGPFDGIYGPLTHAGIRSYQQANNLMLDGIIGPETAGHLNGLSGVALDGLTKL